MGGGGIGRERGGREGGREGEKYEGREQGKWGGKGKERGTEGRREGKGGGTQERRDEGWRRAAEGGEEGRGGGRASERASGSEKDTRSGDGRTDGRRRGWGWEGAAAGRSMPGPRLLITFPYIPVHFRFLRFRFHGRVFTAFRGPCIDRPLPASRRRGPVFYYNSIHSV